MPRQQEIRGRAVPSCGWPSVPRSPSFSRTPESSPAPGGETEPPPPRGSRRLRARARHLAAQGPQALLRSRARAQPRARARRGVRAPAARSEHVGAACPRRADRHRSARHAAGRRAQDPPRRPRRAAVSAAAQGLVRLPVWRARFVLALLALAFAVLAVRSAYLQAVKTDFLQERGDARYSRVIEVPATRGRILDRNGDALAVSTPVKSIWAIPADVELTREQRRKLAALLNIEAAELGKKLASAKDFVYLKRQVPPDTAHAIATLGVPGIYQHPEYRRYYPGGEITAHVLGFTGVDDGGQEGVELAHEATLGGRAGSRRVIKDRLGQIVEDVGSIRAAQDGVDLQLALDAKLQSLAYGALKSAVEANRAKAGGIVAIDVRSGEILALANVPSFNPNNRSKLSGAQLRNRVITDLFEPGSTLKPFTIALALESGKVTPSTRVPTAPGTLAIGGYTIRDVHPAATMSVAQIVQKSSNVGSAKLALALPRESMWDLFRRVGFGTAPALGFPGAAAGKLHPWKTWKPVEQATMAYGHGISLSLVQLARAYT